MLLSRTIACALAAGAVAAWTGGQPLRAQSAAPPAPAPSAAAAAHPDAVALVNGRPIPRARLVELLIAAHGRQMLQGLVALEAVRQEAEARGVTVTPAEVADERERSYPPELKKMEPAQRERLLDQYLEKNGLTRSDWDMALLRNAYLRKLAQDVPEPTEAQLHKVFLRSHGEKVQVRWIQLDTPAALRQVRQRLAAKEPFEKVAAELSVDKATAADGGLAEPFDRGDPAVPEEVRAAAFALENEGDVCDPIIQRGRYHVLQLVKRIAPEKVKYEDVKEELRRQIHDSLVRLRMNQLLRELPARAKIELLDPVIRGQVERDRPLTPPAGGSDDSPRTPTPSPVTDPPANPAG